MGAEYYSAVFAILHRRLELGGFDLSAPPSIRSRYWSLVPPAVYASEEGAELVWRYYSQLLERVEPIVAQHSIAYWLHAYRRLKPTYPGTDAHTAWLVRATLESAFRKYGQLSQCNGIGMTIDLAAEDVLRGELAKVVRATAINEWLSEPQLVLTNFGVDELRELYDLERLAHEIWRCGAVRRALGKGARLRVTDDTTMFRDERSPALAQLLLHFDQADWRFEATSTGAIVDIRHKAYVCPTYNTNQESPDLGLRLLKHFGMPMLMADGAAFNFSLRKLSLRGLREAYLPYGESFRRKQGVVLDHVLAVVGGLLSSTLMAWKESDGTELYRALQRAYSGPTSLDVLADFVLVSLATVTSDLSIDGEITRADVLGVLSWMTLTESLQADIEPMAWGPAHVLVPATDGRVFVDLAWVHLFLYWLAWKLEPSDDAIKGSLLESYTAKLMGDRVLPSGQLRDPDQSSRQVDASSSAGDTLIIVECKAINRSIGTELGHHAAFAHRRRALEKALDEVDDKAGWLKKHPKGHGYDLSRFKQIVPIVCTPFNEFIPTLDSRWWLDDGLARVMTPFQVGEFVKDESAVMSCRWNVVALES